MLRGCLAQIITWGLIGAVVLWFFRAPESVAGLITGAVGLVVSGADALGAFASALTPTLTNLF
ncbi:hypothetical protein [Nocardiopsis metallicus]|uniref:CHASE2 domain-containing sensor protein n=1 Tax=Nocardiopsis metallicus TaxID=179819 RepID=A0A840WFQ1_9ACTN|nr:hypothetical protein [Nocardiopsis metallicus]MBB5495810.1 CHASE2 domain-containing sensor protein [Nocardiopsis metallicus]